jgi:hypothetical protein
MDIATPSLASPSLLALGEYLLSALRYTPDTAELVGAFQPTHDALAAAAEVTRVAEHALIPARVAVVFAERQLEVAIRAVGEDFTRAYDSIAGELKVVFPRDRAQQNLYFDAVRNRPSREDEPDEPVDTLPAPPA